MEERWCVEGTNNSKARIVYKVEGIGKRWHKEAEAGHDKELGF